MTGPIAIVGLDCRFPGAADPARYWDLLTRGGDGVSEVPPTRWDANDFYAEDGTPGRLNTSQGGFMPDPDAFDNEFFTVSPREAAAMDPQQRLVLQCAWRALEDAGVAPAKLRGTPTGVFIGIMSNEWAMLHLTDYARVTAQIGSGNGYCMTANRVSYHLDLKGPSLAVDTACSSSLTGVHLACNALLAGECDYALAGGVNVILTPALNIFYTAAGLSAPDGRCKPFSADANGIGRGEGVGMVVLRRLEDAIADGQQIYAVIRGTAVNQDGRSNGITAPNRWSQQEVVTAAYRRAGVSPEQVTFTEGHGTGTELGDMIEIKALGHLHHDRTDQPMLLGSVKGNLGHTEGAAGIAGLIKVALALHHRLVPASRFAARENPKLKLAEHGIKLLKAPHRLRAGPTIAGLSSFGMGGTNAHVVLESAPPVAASPSRGTGALPVFTVTGTAPDALRRNLLEQADTLARGRTSVAAACWSSNRVKTGQRYRFALPVSPKANLPAKLREAAADEDLLAGLAGSGGRPKVAFLFTGQGAQSPRMTAALYRDSRLYRDFLDEADAALAPHLGRSIRELILSGDELIHQTGFTQPALFAVEYALASALIEAGVRPAYLIGHSVGEFAAGVVAGALPLADAARLITARGTLMQDLPAGGGMLSAQASVDEVRDLVEAEPLVGIGAINGPRATVLSGDLAALDRIDEALRARDIETRKLTVSHGFHSPLMAPMLDRFVEIAGEVGGGLPRLPVLSTVRGRVLDGEPMDAAYWVEHVSAPVRFADAGAALLDAEPTHLVEIGPKPVLLGLLRRLRPTAGVRGLHPVPAAEAGGVEFAEVIADLYRAGLDPEWDALYPPADRVPQRLAPYVFSAEHRYWTQAPVTPGPRAVVTPPTAEHEVDPESDAAPDDPVTLRVAQLPSADIDPVTGAVLDVVAQVGGYVAGEISLRARFYEDLGFDSVSIMELKKRIEAKLPELGALSIQDLLPRMSSVGDLAGYLRERPGSAELQTA